MADLTGAWKTTEEIEQEKIEAEHQRLIAEMTPSAEDRILMLEQAILFLTTENNGVK